MRLSTCSTRLKCLFSAFAVLLAVIGLGLLASGKLSLYGQVAGVRVPDLRGTWNMYMPSECGFQDVFDYTVPAVPICGTPSDTSTDIVINNQVGRVFGGGHPGARDKLTGFLAPDGSVSIHIFSATPNEQVFITATLSIGKKSGYVMSGYAHVYSDLTETAPYMRTVQVYLTKQ